MICDGYVGGVGVGGGRASCVLALHRRATFGAVPSRVPRAVPLRPTCTTTTTDTATNRCVHHYHYNVYFC